MEETLTYTWDEFLVDAEALAQLIRNGDFKSIIAVTKGGLPLASMLAQYLHIPFIDTFAVSSYVAQGERKGTHILKEAMYNMPNPIIVDDICDTGTTLKLIQEKYKCPTLTIFTKPDSIITPTYSLRETTKWVEFPWEVSF